MKNPTINTIPKSSPFWCNHPQSWSWQAFPLQHQVALSTCTSNSLWLTSLTISVAEFRLWKGKILYKYCIYEWSFWCENHLHINGSFSIATVDYHRLYPKNDILQGEPVINSMEAIWKFPWLEDHTFGDAACSKVQLLDMFSFSSVTESCRACKKMLSANRQSQIQMDEHKN